MASPSINVNFPDPFVGHPTYIPAPLTRVIHMNSGQVLASPSGAVFASQLLAPLVVSVTGSATGTWTLPDGFSLANAYGANAMQIYYPRSYDQHSHLVGVGDVFVVPVHPLSTHANTGAFYAPTASGNSGSKIVPAYAVNQNSTDLTIQFTSAGPQPSQYTYTLS